MKVFIAHCERDRDLVESVVTLLREDGHAALVPSEMKAGANILAEISAGIRSADVLIAVVSPGNPNIFYEIGLAVGAGVPTLITARAGELLPADLASIPYVQLTGEVLRDAQMIAWRTKDLEGLAPTKVTHFKSAEAALHAATQDPSVLESLSPADFERLVAELFKERGYEVDATRSKRDSGVDFAIRSKKDRDLVLVEVKKLNRHSRVSVEAVRQLLSVVLSLGAPVGVLVAPSGFTAAALALAAGTPLLLRTLEDVLAAKSEKDLLGHKRVMDYFAAALAGLQAVPVIGPAISKPVLRLYDAEKQEKWNEHVFAHLEKNKKLTSDTLAGIMKLKEAVSIERDGACEISMGLDLLTSAINTLAKGECISSESLLTDWGLPVSKQTLRLELQLNFMRNFQPFYIGITNSSAWEVKDGYETKPSVAIEQFLNEIPARKSQLLPVLEYWLRPKCCPDSKVFRVLHEFLKDEGV